MFQNENLSAIAGVILLIWMLINMIKEVDNVIRMVLSKFLFRKWRYYKFDIIYKAVFSKEFEKNDIDFIKLKIRLNIYIQKYEHSNKSSLNNIVAIIISALLTITMTQYSLQSQGNKELIGQISKNLTNDFMIIFFMITIIYGINGIIQKFSGSKYDYYLMIKNIIKEIEKKEHDKKKSEYKEQIILKLEEMKNVLKENKKETNVIEKIINKFFKAG